jgi:UDP-GlcNAc:undecaprenyl-phosphate/decaprenyl-phosphate GlcNAc-1-phosphate transferase
VLAHPVLNMLRANGHVHANYRGLELPCPAGVLIVVAATAALVPLELIERLAHVHVFYCPQTEVVLLYGFGVAALGLIDDTLGSSEGDPRGWRGHVAALMHGRLSSGVVKAVGSLGLALAATDRLGLSVGRWLLATGVLVLATNALNLLDLRPGRAVKALVVLGAALTIGAGELRQLLTLGVFAGPALVAGWFDLREQAMLGDTGANLLGALAGLWIVLTVGETGQLIALALLLALTVYGELRSISELVQRVPLLRWVDSLGSPSSRHFR